MTTPPSSEWRDPQLHEEAEAQEPGAAIPTIVGVLGIVALALLSFAVYFLFFTGGSKDHDIAAAGGTRQTTSETTSETVTTLTTTASSEKTSPEKPETPLETTAVTSTVVAPSHPESTSQEQTTPANSSTAATPSPHQVAPGIPGGARAVNAPALNGEDPGSYSNVYLSGPTSDDFAMNVHEAYLNSYRNTGQKSGHVNAYSPATGRSYDMTCNDEGSYVHCTGGDGAHVYIS